MNSSFITSRPDLGPNCWQRLSADESSRERVIKGLIYIKNCSEYYKGLVGEYKLFLAEDLWFHVSVDNRKKGFILQ